MVRLSRLTALLIGQSPDWEQTGGEGAVEGFSSHGGQIPLFEYLPLKGEEAAEERFPAGVWGGGVVKLAPHHQDWSGAQRPSPPRNPRWVGTWPHLIPVPLF